jgi:hypothetical protein
MTRDEVNKLIADGKWIFPGVKRSAVPVLKKVYGPDLAHAFMIVDRLLGFAVWGTFVLVGFAIVKWAWLTVFHR